MAGHGWDGWKWIKMAGNVFQMGPAQPGSCSSVVIYYMMMKGFCELLLTDLFCSVSKLSQIYILFNVTHY